MVRRFVERALPVGTRRRLLFSTAMAAARGARGIAGRPGRRRRRRRAETGADTRSQAVRAPDPPRRPAGITYREWFCRLPADPEVLEIQRQWFEEWARPLRVWALVVDDGGDFGATEKSLDSQSWGLLEAVKVEVGALAEEFERLARDRPRDLVMVLRAGDRLRPDAVFRIAQAAWRDPGLELLYWDDDLSALAEIWEWRLAGMPEGVYFDDDLDRLSQPRLKPGWSPDLLVCANYIGRAFAVRARGLEAEAARRYRDGGFEDDSLWWDLLLSLQVADRQVCRLPAVLQAVGRRDHRVESHHLEMVNRWLARRGWPARAEAGAGSVGLAWALDRQPPVSVIIATGHNRELLEGAFDLIRSADHASSASQAGSEPTGIELIIVDNGGRSADNEAWYRDQAADLRPQVVWWDEPFNYSAVNNRAASRAAGEVLVFLNDDTFTGHPGWLQNLVGWAQRPEIGVAGLQLLDADGMIQHGGVVIGMTGLAGHLFCGMAPHSESLMGPTDWTRNTVAVTGACLAVRRSVFEELGGFDERMELCGSDVALGLRACQAGYRNVVSASTPIGHRESATRGPDIPEGDVFASYWSYQRWLMGGDPYFSPNLSADHTEPTMHCEEKPGVLARLTEMLGRPMEVFYQRNETGEAHALSVAAEADRGLAESVRRGHRAVRGRRRVETVNWFVPEFQNPFYGGIHTVFRLADHLAVNHGVQNRFMVMAGPTGHD
ncbi:MAG: glycosyltransferase, partial [bacterium]|nr:glycosyltransferase [bacterium]